MTGFRVTASGQFGLDGVVPDLMTFGKVMGGGFPAAAFGGRAELMHSLAPVGGVYQAGTLSGNPVASAAGATTLRLATPEVYAHVDRAAALLQREVADALGKVGVPHVIQTVGNMFSVFFVGEDVEAVPDYATASTQVTARYAAFFHSMLDAGVYLPPSAVRVVVPVQRPRRPRARPRRQRAPGRGGRRSGGVRWPPSPRSRSAAGAPSCTWCATARSTTRSA